MALNMVHKYTKTEVWQVGANVPSGTAVKSTTNQPGVTLVASGGSTKSTVVGPYTVSGIPSGGIGLSAQKATVAVDGAFRFNVAGASATTAGNTLVYLTGAGALTLTATGNFLFGKIDRFIGETSGTECSVWVGAGVITQAASA